MGSICKKEIVEFLADQHPISKAEAGRILDSLETFMEVQIEKGETVRFPHLGSFSVKTRAARKGRNVQTGESIDVPEKRVVRFRAGKCLRDALNS